MESQAANLLICLKEIFDLTFVEADMGSLQIKTNLLAYCPYDQSSFAKGSKWPRSKLAPK